MADVGCITIVAMPREPGPHFQGGPHRDSMAMVRATAALRDQGGLPAAASLVLSQLLLNLGGHAGRGVAIQLINDFFDAADVPFGGGR